MSQSSHDEAVEAFLQAEEPITVEVLRRNAADSGTNGDDAKPATDANKTGSLKSTASAASSSGHASSSSTSSSGPNSVGIQTDLVLGAHTTEPLSMQKFLQELEDEEEFIEVEGEEDILVPDLDYEVS